LPKKAAALSSIGVINLMPTYFFTVDTHSLQKQKIQKSASFKIFSRRMPRWLPPEAA